MHGIWSLTYILHEGFSDKLLDRVTNYKDYTTNPLSNRHTLCLSKVLKVVVILLDTMRITTHTNQLAMIQPSLSPLKRNEHECNKIHTE